MKTLEEVFKKVQDLDDDIHEILKFSTYDQFHDLDDLEIDRSNKDQLFLWDELRSIMDKLSDIHDSVRYLSAPVVKQSKLHLNQNKRYETEYGHEYTCGCVIEALIDDGWRDSPYWVRTSVEAANGQYYLVGAKNVSLEGLPVRIREVR